MFYLNTYMFLTNILFLIILKNILKTVNMYDKQNHKNRFSLIYFIQFIGYFLIHELRKIIIVNKKEIKLYFI